MDRTPVYRAPMRARDHHTPAGAGAAYGLACGVVGIGPGTGSRRGALVHRFAAVDEGAFVWTRDAAGAYHLGRIAGPMREVASGEAAAVGITHARETEWLAGPVPEAFVPDAVVRTFARGGRNFQRTHDAAAEHRTAEIWRRRAGAEST